ncbi:phytanoyl dioxygenase family [Fusarium mexicanum]|uniref:Phytanoyl dioxygenase family n=1 Tax=Fusarium mexicanum TaxID=751941 RepID=A0A8H5MK69_9HYPO|nr:phytanoyl dioxygenase family [Fusarium mexicanum]
MTVSAPTSEVPKTIQLTDEELDTKSIGSRHLQAALEALHTDGLVVLENAVDLGHLDHLNERMVMDAQKLQAIEKAHINFSKETRNFQQEVVPDEGYVFDDILANPWAGEILQHALGPNPKIRLYSANTAFKAEARQPVHIDIASGFPRAPFGYCVNINLVSTSPENGATEFWLGTHNDPDLAKLTINGSGSDGPDPAVALEKKKARAMALGLPTEYADKLVEKRRKVRPPIQASLPKGSLIIRDIRLWHAGMPNRTDNTRIMLVTVVFSQWYRNSEKIRLPKRWQGRINWGAFDPCVVEWVENDSNYLLGAHEFTLAQIP